MADRALVPEEAYQGSRWRTGYPESRMTERNRLWKRAMKACTNQVPYESP
jgi:hypothetical protein